MVTVTATTKTQSIHAIQRQYSLEIVGPDTVSASDTEIDKVDGPECQSKQFANQELQSEDRELILAAAHIEDAKTGRGRYGKAKYYFKPRHAQICFKVITNQWFQRAIYITVLVHSALAFIEPPSSSPQSIYTYVAIGLNLLCLLLYLADIILNMTFLSWRIFWTLDEHSWNRLEFVFLCGFTIDWIVLIVVAATGNGSVVPPFRSLRLAMIMCKAKNVGHIYNVVKSITIKLGGIMLVVLLFILLYSCIGVHLVMDPYRDIDPFISEIQTPVVDTNVSNSSLPFCPISKEQSRYRIYEGTFDHIGRGAIQLFVLLTTENYPVFMFPAFLVSKFYFVYFGSFLFFGVFFLTAILLAITADLYWKYNKKHVKKERLRQRAELVKAWKLLDICDEEKLQVDDPKFLKLFRILNPKNTDEENMELIYELDPESSGYINWIQWVTQLLLILDLEKTSSQEHRHTKRQHDTHCAITRKLARKVTAWAHFEKVVLLLIVLHCVLFALKWNSMALAAEITVQALKTAIVAIFMVEMLMRFCAIGTAFFTYYLDAIDFFLVTVGFVSNVVWYGSLVPGIRTSVYLWRGSSVVISCLAIFCRLFFNSSQSRRVMLVFIKLFPVMYDLIVLFAIVIYLYAAIGMEAFHRFNIQPDTPNSDHFMYGCGLGFKNFKCSLIVMFQIATTSNWHEIMNSVILNVGNYAPVIYFISCYTVMILVIMNLLIAIGIEAFNKFSESEQSDGSKQEAGPSEAPVLEENYGSIQDLTDTKPHPSGSNLLQKLAEVANVAFSSIRENSIQDEEYGFEDATPPARRNSLSAPHSTASGSGDPCLNGSPSGPLHVKDCSTTHRVLTRQASVYSLPAVKEELEPEEGAKEERREEKKWEHEGGDSDDVFYSETTTLSVTRKCAKQKVEGMEKPKLQSRQSREKLQKRLLEKHRQKRLQRQPVVLTSGSSIDEEELPVEETAAPQGRNTESDALFQGKGTSVNKERPRAINGWGPATNVIKFINSAARRTHRNQVSPQVASDKLHQDTADQDIDCPHYLKTRKNSAVNNKKFRRGFNPNNWRAQVQNLTIINKEEISQLRKELNQHRSPISGRRRYRGAQTMISLPLTESEEDVLQDTKVKVDQRRSSSPTLHQLQRTKGRSSSLSSHEAFVNYVQHKQDSVSSDSTIERPRLDSLTDMQTRRDSLQMSSSSADGDCKHSTSQATASTKRVTFKTPTISVEEAAPEEGLGSTSTLPVSSPTDSEFELKVPKSKGEQKCVHVSAKNSQSDDSGEVPEWAVRLTQQYNIKLQCHTSSESSDNLPTPV